VFAEKPLAANIREARELLSMSRKKRIVHGIDFMFPEIAEWKKVKQILDSKKLGALKHVSVRWSWLSGDIKYNRTSWKTDRAVGGGMLSFYFSHGLNYLEHFVGSIIDADYVSTHLSKRQGGTESGFDMLLRFQNGVRGNVHLSRNSPGRVEHQLIFECEKGILTLENKNAVVDNFLVTIHSQVGMNHISVKKDKGRDGEDERVKIVRKLAKRFVDACIQRKQMQPSFEEGLRVEELIEQILPKNKQDHF
jgi:predicted dehydrogenase